MDLEDLQRHPDAEEKGINVELPCGLIVTVRHPDNADAIKLRQQQLNEHRNVYIAGQTPPAAVLKRQRIELICRTILVGWHGLKSAGKPLEFSKTVAMDVLDQYPDLLAELESAISSPMLFRASTRRVKSGN